MKRTQDDARMESASSAPAKKQLLETYSLPSCAPLAHRPKAGGRKFLPKAVWPAPRYVTNAPNSFDAKSFILHNSVEPSRKAEAREQAAPDPMNTEDDKAFAIRPMATSLPLKILAVPTVAHKALNPFYDPAIDLAGFADQVAKNVFAAVRHVQAWNDLTPGQFQILVHDPPWRKCMVNFTMDFMYLEQLLYYGREDWKLSHLPINFFEDVLDPLRKTGELAMELSKIRASEWMAGAARACSESHRLLRRALEAREEVEQWAGFREAEEARKEEARKEETREEEAILAEFRKAGFIV